MRLNAQYQIKRMEIMNSQTLPGRKKGYQSCKRAFDALLALAALMVLLPVMLLIALLIRLQDGGPAIYRQTRVGRDGRPLCILKFRSMRMGADSQLAQLSEEKKSQYRQEFKIDADPRVTRVGAFLRRTSLDELPQLWCVLTGQMSLVGPRPVLPDELETFYSAQEQQILLSVLPGLTGYWQACSKPEDTYTTGGRQRMELEYARKASFGWDLKLLGDTFGAIIRKAYTNKGN